jgi:hypothetical protein
LNGDAISGNSTFHAGGGIDVLGNADSR